MMKGVALVLGIHVAGCGLLQTRGPDPHRRPGVRPVCSETMDAPKRDSIGAVLGFVTLLAGLLLLEGDDNEDIGAPMVVGGAVVMAGSYASGGVGYFRVKRCQRAIAEHERTQSPPPPPPVIGPSS